MGAAGAAIALRARQSRPDATQAPRGSTAATAPSTAPAVTYHGPPIVGYVRAATGEPIVGVGVYVTAPDRSIEVIESPKFELRVSLESVEVSPDGQVKVHNYR